MNFQAHLKILEMLNLILFTFENFADVVAYSRIHLRALNFVRHVTTIFHTAI